MRRPALRSLWSATLVILTIELLDELVYGAQGAALPVIRADLNLNYEQIGLLLSVPALVGNALEPALGILGDVWKRKALIVGGGLVFALALAIIGFSQTFIALLVGFVIFYPAGGAFVSLSQATLMDLNPGRHEQMMARWTLFGSVGVVGGSLLVSGGLALGWGWRALYLGFAVFALALVALIWSQRAAHASVTDTFQEADVTAGFRAGVVSALRALSDRNILRWLILLELCNLILDIFLEFAPLYFTDVVQVTTAEAALAVTVLSVAGLVGGFFIIPLLERVRGLTYLRWSALLVLMVYAALLATPVVGLKYILLAVVGLLTAGWYAIVRGQLYSAMPGQSGTSMALSSVAAMAAGVTPWLLGLAAENFGLEWAMVLLALGPIGLLVGIPRARQPLPESAV
ncbi:MAG: MFS transporter [Chloroflexi bacterium]|nr:MFS transporter [Chloroflexota bacterium]